MVNIKKKIIFNILLCIGYNNFSALSTLEKMDIETGNKKSVSSTNNKKKEAQTKVSLNYESNEKIFAVNRDILFEKTAAAQDIKKTMQTVEEDLLESLRPIINEFEREKAEYERKAKTLSREALAAQEEKLMALGQEIQMKQMSANENFRKEEMRLTKDFLQLLNESTKDFLSLKENKNVILIPMDNSFYVHPEYDATNEIITIMDKNFQSKKTPITTKNASAKASVKSTPSEGITASTPAAATKTAIKA